MNYDTEIPTGDYDVDTVPRDIDVDTPSGHIVVAPQPLTHTDRVALGVAGFFAAATIIGAIVTMILL